MISNIATPREAIDHPTPVASLLRSEDRIIEVHPPDMSVARDLAHNGHHHYLALVFDDQVDAMVSAEPALAHRIVAASVVADLSQVGTDVLILHGRAIRHLWDPAGIKAKIVIVPTDSIERRIAAAIPRLSGRLHEFATLDCGGRTYSVFKNHSHNTSEQTRIYLSPVIGYSGLGAALDTAGVRAVVLRWFESLPHVEPGEDLDLLVSDEDTDRTRAVITAEPGILPIDLYSVSGIPGSDREGLPCYPPPLARRILDNAVRHTSGMWVPIPADHLHSLAYHAVYHKGHTSGLASALVTFDPADAEHDYTAVIADIAARMGRAVPTDLESLDSYLETVGWKPPHDTLRRLSSTNTWVRRRFFDTPFADEEVPGLTVFVLRQRALEILSVSDIEKLLDHLGFEILEFRTLDPDAADRCRHVMRGGNWGRGPYPTSGGVPTHAIFALHYGPSEVTKRLRHRYPHLTNAEVLVAKEKLRDMVNQRVTPELRCNPIHSSDNEDEAWEYQALIDPAGTRGLRSSIEHRRVQFRTPQPVVRTLRRGRRAKVEVVEDSDRLVVRKTFAPGYRRHFERELRAAEAFAEIPGIPPTVASGPGWITRPYYEDRLRVDHGKPELISLRVLREMVSILRAMHEAGFALIDAKPSNFLMDDAGVKLIDFEFLYEYPGPRPHFHDSYSWHGPLPDSEIDAPVGGFSYTMIWLPWTGMSVETLCDGSPTQQRLARLRHRVRATTHAAARFPVRVVRKVTTHARWHYRSWARLRARSV